MQSDVKTPRHLTREVTGFKGLRTAAEDARAIPDGWLSTANNIVFDDLGNARPKDGSEIWWPQISQRVYLAEMEVGESTWTNGAATSATKAFGYQSRVISASGSTDMTRAIASAVDLLLAGNYTTAQTSLNLSVRAATPSDILSCTLLVSSNAFISNTRSWTLTTDMQGLAAGTWTTITKTLASGTDTGGAPDFTAINRVRISVTCSGGAAVYFDEIYASFNNYDKSFCLGAIEYRRTTDSKRYTVAAFGDTVYSDLNEAKTPAKILSQLTRNLPLRYDIAEDRLALVNGVDPGYIFDGDFVRRIGFPAPTSWVPGFTYSGSGTLAPGDTYYYGVTFVYGVSTARHGQSTMFESPTPATVSAGNSTINLAALPVGAVGAGVIARRIWRCRANAGPLASKYFVAEIADNTTTTYADSLADSTILAGDVGPLNNGVPPVAKTCTWFQKAMVYLTKTAVYWSRPGVNLDESFEIVPAENFLLMGSSGELVGAVEFNGNLYVFARSGLAKLQWAGSVLTSIPVQRTAEHRAGNIGAADDRAITVVQDRYIRFMDTFGQVWKMLPNEEIQPESRNVSNILDDFNSLPLISSFDYSVSDSQAQWQAGTLAASSNLSTTDQVGALQYGQGSNLGGGGEVFAPIETTVAYEEQPPWTGYVLLAPEFSNTGDTVEIILRPSVADKAVGIDRISFYTNYRDTSGFYPNNLLTFTYTLSKRRYEGSTAAPLAGTNVAGGALSPALHFTGTYVQQTITLSSRVYVPANEVVVLTLRWAGATTSVGNVRLQSTSNGQAALTIAAERPNNTPMAFGWAGTTYTSGDVQTGTILDYGNDTQRFMFFNYDPATPVPTLRSAYSMEVWAEFSSDGINFLAPQKVYEKIYTAPLISPYEWATIENAYYAQQPDYRVGQPYPASTQWRYVRMLARFVVGGQAVPTMEAQSRVGTAKSLALPVLYNPEMKASTQASFATYDKVNYLRDIWTSEIVSTAGIARFGKLYADYVEKQQELTFQVRTATSSGGIAAATWYDVTPNSEVGTTGLVAAATHFQYRIIFQDNPGKITGEPTYVNEVRWSWAVSGSEAAPMTPPVLFHYKDYTFLSWPSRASRINDSSMAIDDYTLAYENEDGHRWSKFWAPHYACYCVVGSKLIGGTATGGRLVRLRNSAVTEFYETPVFCQLATVPMNLGSMFIKTLHWLYLGLVLNVHKNGVFLREQGQWPLAQQGWTFQWGVSGNRLPSLTFGAPPDPSTFQPFGQVFGQGSDTGLLPHSAQQNILLSFPNMKPYQAEYGFDMGLQERAFMFYASWQAKATIVAPIENVFPTLTNLGMEFYIENYRGV